MAGRYYQANTFNGIGVKYTIHLTILWLHTVYSYYSFNSVSNCHNSKIILTETEEGIPNV